MRLFAQISIIPQSELSTQHPLLATDRDRHRLGLAFQQTPYLKQRDLIGRLAINLQDYVADLEPAIIRRRMGANLIHDKLPIFSGNDEPALVGAVDAIVSISFLEKGFLILEINRHDVSREIAKSQAVKRTCFGRYEHVPMNVPAQAGTVHKSVHPHCKIGRQSLHGAICRSHQPLSLKPRQHRRP